MLSASGAASSPSGRPDDSRAQSFAPCSKLCERNAVRNCQVGAITQLSLSEACTLHNPHSSTRYSFLCSQGYPRPGMNVLATRTGLASRGTPFHNGSLVG
jgi:hypothetical protein